MFFLFFSFFFFFFLFKKKEKKETSININIYLHHHVPCPGTSARDRRVLQQLALNVHVKKIRQIQIMTYLRTCITCYSFQWARLDDAWCMWCQSQSALFDPLDYSLQPSLENIYSNFSLLYLWSNIFHPWSYFTFQPVLHDWWNKDCGMCYPVCEMVHINNPCC